LWEVFIRSRQGLSHKHVGSLHAADEAMALENARDVYTRRHGRIEHLGCSLREAITASSPTEKDVMFDPANDKVYRHPTFYKLPDEIKNM
jgi:ring-1,2-phenylacetyl-CoA epoxidase subunit PaaB